MRGKVELKFVQIRSKCSLNDNMADHILMLNGFCFLKIFKHLSTYALANFKEAYGSVGAVVDMEFTRRTRGSLDFEWEEEECIDADLQLIRQFGPTLKCLEICYGSSSSTKWSRILSVIGKNCSEKLENFTLSGNMWYIENADALLIAGILKNVTKLTLRNSYYSRNEVPHDFIGILSHCEKATSISLHSLGGIDVHKTMFQTNKNLQDLELIGPIRDGGVKIIVDNLTNAPLRYFLRFGGNFFRIYRFNVLKHCAIDCSFVNLNSFLRDVNAFHSLNVLTLIRARLDERNISTLRRMAKLKVLELVLTESRFKSLLDLCGNKNLEQLIIFFYREVVTEEKYLRAIEIRKASKAEKCLHLTLRPQVYDEAIRVLPSELLKANEKTIKLTSYGRYVHERYRY